jgi:hypothetical protein
MAEVQRQLSTRKGAMWPRFYTAYHVMVGALLGIGAAGLSLLANILGSLMVGLHPLQLIRVFLTFPLGEQALSTEDGFALSAGCFLYLGTGMFFGALVHLILQKRFHERTLLQRVVFAAGIGILLWGVNFYLVLSWLQPLLFGGRWIVTEIPFWVSAGTHLLFAVLIALGGRWGQFEPPVRGEPATKDPSRV